MYIYNLTQPKHLYRLDKDDCNDDVTILRVECKQANWYTSLSQASHTLQDRDSLLVLLCQEPGMNKLTTGF